VHDAGTPYFEVKLLSVSRFCVNPRRYLWGLAPCPHDEIRVTEHISHVVEAAR